MSRSVSTSRITKFGINTRAFTAPTERQTPQGMQTVMGAQVPSLAVVVDMYLGDTDQKLGSEEYNFGPTARPAVDGIDLGLPAYTDIISQQQVDQVTVAMENLIDQHQPAFSIAQGEIGDDLGPVRYLRVNRVMVNLPAAKADQYVQALVSVYTDAGYTNQLPALGWEVGFVSDEFIRQRWGQDITDERLAEIRAENNLFPLSSLLQDTGVATALTTVAQQLYTTLKAKVLSWSGVDVTKIMQRHLAALAAMLPAAPAE